MVEHPEFPPLAVPAPARIAQLSDPHLTTPSLEDWRQIGAKRLLSYLSWHRKRRFLHLPGVLAAVVENIGAERPDHLLVTGDLTHLGLPRECREALAWLATLGDPHDVSVIPGNHDRLVADDPEATVGLWQAFATSDPRAAAGADPGAAAILRAGDGYEHGRGWPILRRRGAIALIGLDTAVPTAPLLASGRLGRAQLDRLAGLLDALGREGLFRLVFLHHSPLPDGHAWRKRLRDADALLEVLTAKGAELVVHGHGHREAFAMVETAVGPMLVVGAPSASLAGDGRAGWNNYCIERLATAWSVTVELHRYGPAEVTLRESGVHRLARQTR